MKTIAAPCLTLALVLAGCTELHVGPMGQARVTSGPQPQAYSRGALQPGFIYNLPAAKISPSAYVRIADCPIDEEALKTLKLYNKAPPRPVTEIKFAVGGDIAVAQIRGPKIVIDYRALGAFLKTSSVGIERHPNGMLKAVNAAMEDDSPAVIADIAAIAGTIALASTGAPQAAAALKKSKSAGWKAAGLEMMAPATRTVKYLTCSDDTFELVKKRAALVDARDKSTAELEEANGALARLLVQTAVGFSQEDLRQIRAYRDKITQLTAAIAGANEGIDAANGKLTLPLVTSVEAASLGDILDGKVTLQPDRDSSAPKRLDAFVAAHFANASAEIAVGLADDFDRRKCTAVTDSSCGSVTQVARLIQKIALVTPRSRRIGVEAGSGPDFSMDEDRYFRAQSRLKPVHPGDGIVYVEPARYDIWLEAPTFPASVIAPTRRLKTVEAASIPQQGTYLSLPVRAGFGEKVELKASFDTDGSLLTASYGRSGSVAKALTGAGRGLADQYLTSRDAIADRKLKLLKARTDMLTAQKAYQDAQDKLDPVPPAVDPLKDINAQIAMAQAQATLAEANLRIMEANRKLNGAE